MLLVARNLNVSDFGVFSAVTNLIVITISLTDLGIASGVVNFVSEKLSKGEKEPAREYIKAAFLTRLTVSFIFSLAIFLAAGFISPTLLATPDRKMAFWVAAISLAMAPSMLLPYVLQAQKRFFASVASDASFYISRLVFVFALLLLGSLNLSGFLMAFLFGAALGGSFGLALVSSNFLKSKPPKSVYQKLLGFSGWLGVNRIISSVAGRLDVQMLAVLAGSVVTGLYSIPSRLAGFIVVLASSFSSVLASRLAGFNDKEKERTYILKATLALVPIAVAIGVWVAFARPFIVILFGDKYLSAVPVFQVLAVSMIPFLFTVPSVTAAIYSLKKPIFIGAFSFFQLAFVLVMNLFLIPKYGAFGPAITYGALNSILAIYSWSIVIRYYWFSK